MTKNDAFGRRSCCGGLQAHSAHAQLDSLFGNLMQAGEQDGRAFCDLRQLRPDTTHLCRKRFRGATQPVMAATITAPAPLFAGTAGAHNGKVTYQNVQIHRAAHVSHF